MEAAMASYPDLAHDDVVESSEITAATDGDDVRDPWLNYVISEEDAAALLAMLRQLDNHWA